VVNRNSNDRHPLLELLAMPVMVLSALHRFEVPLLSAICFVFMFVLSTVGMLLVIVTRVSSSVLTCDISSTVNQSTLTETAVDGPVVVYIDDAKLVSTDVFSFDDEPVIVDVSPRVSIRR